MDYYNEASWFTVFRRLKKVYLLGLGADGPSSANRIRTPTPAVTMRFGRRFGESRIASPISGAR
jgi:hypothetical protein